MKIFTTLVLALILTCSAAKAVVPVITMTTSNSMGSKFTFSFSLGASTENTPVQIDFGDGILVNRVVGTSAVSVSGTHIASSTVKVYGNNLTYLDCKKNRISSIDVSQNSALSYLSCSDNQLTALDVSQNTALTLLGCSNNKLTALDVSQNSALTYLNCDENFIIAIDVSQNTKLNYLYCHNNLLTALDVSKNTALNILYCYSNDLTILDVSKNSALIALFCYDNQLTALDVSQNSALTQLNCFYNQLTGLDVSKNTALGNLNCSNNQLTLLDVSKNTALIALSCCDNQLTALDVSKNTSLTGLFCYNNQLTLLDVNKNTALTNLDCNNNQLTVLDVSKNTALKSLDCNDNQLTALDVSKNTALTWLECFNNRLNFKSLPIKQLTWNYYSYAPQDSVPIAKIINTGETLDLSSQLLINGVATTYTWKTKSGATLISGFDYTITNGVTTFLVPQAELVYCVMYNSTFYHLGVNNALKTTAINVSSGTISMTTTMAPGSTFSFYLEAGTDNTPVQVYFGNSVLVNQTIGTTATKITGPLVGSQAVNIYGDNITYLDCHSCQLTDLDVKKSALTRIECHDNRLNFKSLPLKQTAWTYYSYAPQDSMPIAKIIDTGANLDLSSQLLINGVTTTYTWKTKSGATLGLNDDYTILNGITTFLKAQVEPVYCELTNSEFPDLSGALALKTTAINVLSPFTMSTTMALGSIFSFSLEASVANTPIQVDFGNGVLINQTIGTSTTTVSGTLVGAQTVKVYGDNVTYLDCSSNQLTALDVSKNSALTNLNCSSNQLTSLDISKNSALTRLDCRYNQLTGLDVSKNRALTGLECHDNRLNFKSLPIKQPTWTYYSYSPQDSVPIAKTIDTGTILDLSSQLLVNGVNTIYTWKTKSGTTLVLNTDYAITNGITTFLKPQAYLVYCEMTNSNFANFFGVNALKTTAINVSLGSKMTMTMTTEMALGSTFSFNLAASADNTPIQVDFGDGVLVDKVIGTSPIKVSGTLVRSQTVKVYGNNLIHLNCEINRLTALDVSKNTALTNLNCSINPLTALDVSKNSALTYLRCACTELTALDVSNNTVLSALLCHNNQLTALDVSKNTALTTLDCGINKLTALDVSKNTVLTDLFCNDNQLTTLDVSKNTALTWLYCYGNQLTALDVSQNTALTALRCNNNRLNFESLPIKQTAWTYYFYSPQDLVPIDTMIHTGEPLDLSSQLLVGGVNTIYTWKTIYGAELVSGIDYSITNGITTFLKPQIELVYCEMTNSNFPNFSGDNTLKTTDINVFAGYSTMSMTMTTKMVLGSTFEFILAAKTDNTLVQVDFGDGVLVDKTIGTTATTVSGTLVGTQTVKVYGSLTHLDCNNNQLTALDVSQDSLLTYLYCYNNQLTVLDISKNKALSILSCNDNPLTALDVSQNSSLHRLDCNENLLTALDISNNIELTYLECSLNPLATLDVSKNTALNDLRCYGNQLTSLDVSKNTALTYFFCGKNQLITLDVSQNAALSWFECSDNSLSALDISKNSALIHLVCSYNLLTSLDISKNTALTGLYCSVNQLTVLDVSKNAALKFLQCDDNQLTVLDVSQNSEFNFLRCSDNRLNFKSLPIKKAGWDTYYYTPQDSISIAKTINIGVTIDLSSQLLVNGVKTIYTWKTKSGATLVSGIDYSITNGRTTFLKPQAEPVCCEMTNSEFPHLSGALALKTTAITITKGPSSITWPTPTAITYGTALSATQLNATVTGTTGSATYTPALGTILDAGTHTLTVTFASDLNYELVSKSVTLVVDLNTAIETTSLSDVKVYPNPICSGNVTVTVPLVSKAVLSVISMDGSIILLKDITSELTEVNVDNLPVGMYLFRIDTPYETTVRKVNKQ